MRIGRVFACAIFACGAFPSLGVAQTAPAAANVKPPAAQDAQKSAFLAMPEADRKAAQDALGWLGLYNGTIDGTFGKRTLDSIMAYQASVNAAPDGVISPQQLGTLKAAAQKARATVGFQTLDDPLTGVRIGAPLKLLDKRSAGVGQTRWANRDGSLTLDLMAPTGALPDLYKWLVADAPRRKVTYKALKPDTFFVVAGEEGGRKFYLRYAQAPATAPEPGALRGFVFSYPAAQAGALDSIALAVANSFDPFPTGAPIKQNDVAKAPTPGPTPSPTPTPIAPALTATALIVAPGQALTALREADCKEPAIEGKPVKFLRADAASGLALLGGELGAGGAAPSRSAGGADWIVLSLSPGAVHGRVVLEAADSPSAAMGEGRQGAVVALAASARGAPIFDRQGGLAGLVAPFAGAPKRRGGVVLAEPHETIGAEAMKGFVAFAEAPPPAEPLGAAEIARRMRGAIVGVFCAP